MGALQIVFVPASMFILFAADKFILPLYEDSMLPMVLISRLLAMSIFWPATNVEPTDNEVSIVFLIPVEVVFINPAP